MVRSEKAKTASLILALTVLVLLPFETRGIYSGASITDRCLYPFFHANIFHAMLNVWCLLSIVFNMRVTPFQLLLAYIVSVLYPAELFQSHEPTIGLSGVCYVLIGITFHQFSNRLYFAVTTAIMFGIGHILHASNNKLHLYTLAAGLIIGQIYKQWYKR